MSFLSSSVGTPLMTFSSTLLMNITLFSSSASASGLGLRRSMRFFLEKGFYLNTHLVLWYYSWIFFCLAFTPHADCCVNACGQPTFQMIEGSIVMNSRVRGVLPPVSSHAVAKRVINTLWPSVDDLTCTYLFLNLIKDIPMCFKLSSFCAS